jgi:peptidoglycan/LPS O-acetylase OafA/YrhL
VYALCLLIGAGIAGTSGFYRARLAESAAGRFEALDGLRGLLAYAVLGVHAFNMQRFLASGEWAGDTSSYSACAAYVGVSLFFAITAFLFWLKVLRCGGTFNTRAFYLSRLRRLVPMYAMSVLMAFAVVLSLTGLVLHESVHTLAREVRAWISFGFIRNESLNGVKDAHIINAVYWTLPFEWIFYVALPFLALFARGRASALLFAAVLFFGISGPIVLNFLFGALAALLVHRGTLEGRLGSPWLAPVPLAALAGCLLAQERYPLLQPALLFVFFVFVVHGFDVFGLLRLRAAKVLGTVSYSLYLTHCIVLFVVFHAAHGVVQVGTLGALQFWMLVAVAAAATVVLSAVTYRFVEYPFINPQAAATPAVAATARMQSA